MKMKRYLLVSDVIPEQDKEPKEDEPRVKWPFSKGTSIGKVE